MPGSSRRVALLDVNVLVALFDPDHVHHEPAHDWFSDHRRDGWATCPITENGFVRVVSNPAYGVEGLRAEAALKRLRTFISSGHHAAWHDDLSLTDSRVFDLSFVSGPRQVTDVYLLGLALRRKGRLVTFDRTIPLKAVKGATADTMHVIGPGEP